ncbi:MAG: hypothetical protein U0W24_19070 [Bacteroidales bacterium]
MKAKILFSVVISIIVQLNVLNAYSQLLLGYNFKIVNMMPNLQSNDTANDAETNIAVNPANKSIIIGTAFTLNPTGSTNSAPIYVSTNGGTTWSLNNILPSGNGMTGDISVGFGSSSGTLYTGILRGGSWLRRMMLRTTNPSSNTMMTILSDDSTIQVDQPFVSATTVNDASNIEKDRVFSGDNLFEERIPLGGTGRTAEVLVSNDGESDPFLGYTNRILDVRSTFQQDMPAIRMAIHDSGVVYGIFYSWTSGNVPNSRCDVVVVRDDNFAIGNSPFSALVDSGDALSGQRVVTDRLVPAFGVSLGNNRLVASNLAIAVDPKNSANVFIGWCDRVGTNDYTLHFRRSTDSGQTWGSDDWLTVTNATNPGIAVASDGNVGLIYQQFTGTGANSRWETHFRLVPVSGNNFSDNILSTFLNSDLAISSTLPNFLGDYLRIQAVGNAFYGVFPASNRPINGNFPMSVTFQRNADFISNQLRNTANNANVNVSVDPFFFKIYPKTKSICDQNPKICDWLYIKDLVLRFPPYPCIKCLFPCLQCPPFEFPFEEIYKPVFGENRPKTVLAIPYFHLFLEGYNPRDFEIVVTTPDGEPIKQMINKSGKGYTISFRPSKSNFNKKTGIRDLKILAIPMNSEAALKGAEFNFTLEASDYQFKEFIQIKKSKY